LVFFGEETLSEIAASSHHVIAITTSGKTYGWGTDNNGELVQVIGMARSPVLLDTGMLTMKHVYLSDTTTALIDSVGHLWMSGDNSKNQLGKSSDLYTSSDILRKITAANTEFQYATYVGTGNDFTVGVTNFGRMIAFGNPSDGRLGIISTEEKLLPTIVSDEMEYVYQVTAFENGMIALGSTGRMYSFGSNMVGALGRGYETSQVWTPSQIDHPMAVNIVKIASGSNHIVALTKNGTVLAWGSNESFQLGVEGMTSYFADPIPAFSHKKSHFLTFLISFIIFGFVIFNEIIFYYVYYEKERQIFKPESQFGR
jgi:alpha-tubulin suppressor-like RCC1 family protein